jgi:hypothetical protein
MVDLVVSSFDYDAFDNFTSNTHLTVLRIEDATANEDLLGMIDPVLKKKGFTRTPSVENSFLFVYKREKGQ